jgi:hypothetical protein
MRGALSFSLSCVVAMAIVACATAGGEVTIGPERFDASRPPAPEQPCFIEKGDGSKWSDLYRDFFGPTGQAGSCSFRTNCHGNADQAGARDSFGFVCGGDKSECRATLVKTGFVTEEDKANPEKAGLLLGLLRLRNPDGTFRGIMPKEPANCVFTDKSLTRIKTWIANGIPDD